MLTPYEAAVLKGAIACAEYLKDMKTVDEHEEENTPIIPEKEEDVEGQPEDKEEEEKED